VITGFKVKRGFSGCITKVLAVFQRRDDFACCIKGGINQNVKVSLPVNYLASRGNADTRPSFIG
jgi:hypothetical protein